jgi:quinol monooxygenase YgiN
MPTDAAEQPIAILGWIDVEPAERDALVASTVDLQHATRTDEPGCLAYVIGADPVHAGRIQITELWESSAALDAHFAHPNFRATGAALRGATRLGGGAVKYRIDAVGEVRRADGTVSASFSDDEMIGSTT